MKYLRYVVLFAALVVNAAPAQEIPEKGFTMDWRDNAGSLVNLSFLLDAPAGGGGHIRIKDGHLVKPNGERFRIWGVNLAVSSCFPSKEDAPVIAAHLARFGINCVRLHFLDSNWSGSVFVAGRDDTRALDPQQLDRLDYFLDKAKQREYAQTRLRDIPSQAYEQIVLHLGHELQREIGGQRVAELEDDLKQALQQYFRLIELEDALQQDLQPYLAQKDYFVDEEKLVGLDDQTLAEWREETEGLTLLLGRRELKAIEEQRLADLSPEVQASIQGYIREEDYCRDEGKYRAFQQQTLADLDERVRAQVFRILHQEPCRRHCPLAAFLCQPIADRFGGIAE